MSVPAHAYHFDLRSKVAGSSEGSSALAELTRDPVRANPVSIVQLGLGALQHGDRRLLPLVGGVVDWVLARADSAGLLAYRFPMPHTYPLDAPWASSLAQAEAASLLVRASEALGRRDLLAAAGRIAAPLLDPASGLVASTREGPVLQEYPTDPPAHVLNGWIASLFGLYDVSRAGAGDAGAAEDAFAAGAAAVAARIGMYRTAPGWSLYDLYPHPVANVASRFYHRLHVGHLRALDAIAPDPRLAAAAGEWERALSSVAASGAATARKVAFRIVRPRSRRVRGGCRV